MPVYLFTLHAYRSWNADDPRGYVRRGQGLLEPNPGVAAAYNMTATESAVRFSEHNQRTICWIAYDLCLRREWRLHAIAIIPSHAHVLMSWTDDSDRRKVFQKVKNLMSLQLNKKSLRSRKHWFSRGGSKQPVEDRDHFEYLLYKYLPEHNGFFWREGDDPPVEPESCG